jgi:diguanylate cyclase (GGDEF)-like protein/PAS domain S-box-containing protein
MKTTDTLDHSPRSTILVVDDERLNQEALVSLLKLDHHVKVAGNGARALDIAQSPPPPDLILLDVKMPNMDGYEVFRKLRENPLTCEIPVIFVTAASDRESETQGLQLGAMDYIIKPINPAITLLRVRNQLLIKDALNKLRLMDKLFENAMDSIMITDAACNIISINPAFSRVTGYAPAEVIGKNPKILKSNRHDPAFYEEMWRSIRTMGYWSGEHWNRSKYGEDYPELCNISAITDSKGAVTHYVSIASNISLLKQHETQLERIAHYDNLTGIPNRALLADRMKQAIAQAKRECKLLGVLYLDLDGFKPVNDSLGHEVGDQVLIEIAKRLSQALREGDTVARLGGDEFVVLLPGLGQVEEGIAVLRRIHAAIALPIVVQGESFSLSASIGVSLFPDDGDDPDLLLRHADQAMYAAKQAGKNRYQLYDHKHDLQSRARHAAVARLQQGLESEEFELYYQPIINLASRQIVGAEALIRWNHPERGLLLPGAFLHDISHPKQEIQMGEWVIQAALRQLAQWRANGLLLDISVNIAASHLQSKGFADHLRQACARHPTLSGARLHIEILESAALEDFPAATAAIEACRQISGAQFALDDFGTGYSSLAYLHRLPIDALKIDQSFVRDMLTDPGDNAIVQGIIALAKAFGIKTVAEGMETPAHCQALLELGCQFGQGYGIARPMPASQLPSWIKAWEAGLSA